MTMSESVAVVEYSIRARFDEICERLRESQCNDRLEKPVGYWAVAGDRRLPYALLERKVSDLISTPLKELARTPAIGKKKLASLVVLLERVYAEHRPAASQVVVRAEAVAPSETLESRFAPESVSESMWESWRGTVRSFQLAAEPLGRFAPSLRALPTVIWDAPLSQYLDMPLVQLRRLKTHGDKRVRNVLEVYYSIHQILNDSKVPRHLFVSVRPSFVIPIEQWLGDVLRRDDLPALQEIRQNLVLPLLNQIESDSDESVGRLVAGRIGVESSPESAIEQAERLSVTRARIYQLLEQAARIMKVRWPEGRWQLTAFSEQWQKVSATDERRQMLELFRSLLYPEKLRAEPVKPEQVPAATPA
jgi:hypothetical protein